MPRKLRPFSGQAVNLRQKTSQKLAVKLPELFPFFLQAVFILHLPSGLRLFMSSIGKQSLLNIEEAPLFFRQMQEGIPIRNKAIVIFE